MRCCEDCRYFGGRDDRGTPICWTRGATEMIRTAQRASLAGANALNRCETFVLIATEVDKPNDQ
ncbi:hypothetical protein SAMN04488595_101243 [Ralstonia sp. 25mfcol4.1]|nr:hypothetical protein SAMN04488595_101243 [Ralstonia sp. 25mfcol4.1]